MPKSISVGISDFKTMIIEDYYYIDKTMYIKDIIDNKDMAILVTRPRRFGKTLNMSMLHYYFDISKESKKLFEGLKIMDAGDEYTSKMNGYPCIYLSLNKVKSDSYDKMLLGLKTAILEVYCQHMYLLESEKIYDFEKERIKNILYARENEVELSNSIYELSWYLSRIYEKKVMLFIDEYDVPLQNAYLNGYYNKAISFFKEFYSASFKDNKYLQKAVLTGVSRVAKESIFSGMNNLSVYTVLNSEFAESFGITTEEIEDIVKEFGVEDKKEEIKKWYDGYKMGEVDGIYSPWSVLNYLKFKKVVPYWVNTSSNDIIKLVLKNSYTIKEELERLLNGEEIEVEANFDTVINGIEKNEKNIWGLFTGSGYLKITKIIDEIKNMYMVKIPNYEIKNLFEEIVRDWFFDKVIGNDLNTILKDLINLNINEFERKFKELVKEMMSYMDVGKSTAENFYHAFVLGMLVGLKDTYYVRSNRESGFGRYDIMLEPKEKSGNAFIMEFKVYEEDYEENIQKTIEAAKEQIENKGYEEELKTRGYENITKMVYAFKGKEVKMVVY